LSPASVVNVVYVVEGSELIGASEGDDLAVACISGRLKAWHVRGVIRGGHPGTSKRADFMADIWQKTTQFFASKGLRTQNANTVFSLF
jgi:hypothetical protein